MTDSDNHQNAAALKRVREVRRRVQQLGRLYGRDEAGVLLRGPVDDELQLLEYMLETEHDRQ